MKFQETSRRRKTSHGFTLIELLLVIALMLILGVFMLPVGISYYRTSVLDETTEKIETMLRDAYSASSSGVHDNAHGVKFDTNGYVLFEGLSYDTRVTAEDFFIAIPDVITTSGISEVVFSEITGIPDVSGTLIVSYGSLEKYIIIGPQGHIEH